MIEILDKTGSVIVWIFRGIAFLITAGTISLGFYFLFKIIIVENIRKIFKKQTLSKDKEILEKNPFGKKR